MLGPVDYVVLGFAGSKFDGSIMHELTAASSKGIIRVLDMIFIIKDKGGNVVEGEYADQSDDLKQSFGDFTMETGTPLLTHHDIAKIGEQMEPGTAAGVLIIEHVWARNLKQAIADAGGFLVGDGRIHPEKVEAAVEDLQQTAAQ